jgi:hypothetical protein
MSFLKLLLTQNSVDLNVLKLVHTFLYDNQKAKATFKRIGLVEILNGIQKTTKEDEARKYLEIIRNGFF